MRIAALLAAGTLGLCGCGAGTGLVVHHGGHKRPADSAPAASVKVIRGWADALRSGHVAAAAAYFRIPSVFAGDGGPPVELRSRTQAEIANAGLPCGAELVSTHRAGRFINALFRLTDRGGPGGEQGCGSGAGQTARTNFLIRDGRIIAWLRAPDQPGDNGTPRTPSSPPTTPQQTGTALA